MHEPHKQRILLADDEPQLGRLVARTLERAGYSVTVTTNGRDAVARYAEDPGGFALAILDLYMPEMRGDETYYLLREMNPDARFLFVSGYAREDVWSGLRGQPHVRWLSKPFRSADLVAAVRQLLDDGDGAGA